MEEVIDLCDILAELPQDEQSEIALRGGAFAVAFETSRGPVGDLLRSSGIKLIAELPDGRLVRLPKPIAV